MYEDYEDFDETEETTEIKDTGELPSKEGPEDSEKPKAATRTGELTFHGNSHHEEPGESNGFGPRGRSDVTFGGACDESFWKSRAMEYYEDGNMSKYKECMEKAAAAANS